ncbi:MAG TPA: valine--tRNA ligase [Sphingomonas sp.]|nr:valine--tRNA ligase [Sphingomonas sp.]
MSELPKTFDPAAIEARWYAHWEETGAFRPARPDAEPFTIVMPPPNVTGSLHIGHALDNTLQDILIRHARLKGKDALWVAGTDHAGIATQMVVEREMALSQQKRTDFSRDDFIQKVWAWKAESGGQITRQLRRLGASCDWSNERFTMDEGMTRATMKVFVDLHREGLIYRDKRLVNWDPALKTAISDLEVESHAVNGHMWHFKYPLAGGETYTYVERDADGNVVLEEERDYISIATTRPETMLGDGAVAVHPGDKRYAPIVGKLCEIPVGPKALRRLIPIITDDYPDPDFGSGAVKITGAHDENDYGVAQRNHIPMYRLMDEAAAMRADGAPYAAAAARAQEIAAGAEWTAKEVDTLNLVPEAYRGLDRYDARKAVVADIDADGLLIKVEDKQIMQPFGDRGGVVIEPMLTDQWYVDAKTLAGPAIDAVRSGTINVVPKTWEKTWFQWLENIQPWCVSRQLWWGHQIPAWYDSDGKPYVAESEEAARELAGGRELTRDPDVLDTWFSSALWPFGTLGWPEQTDALAKHYPGDVLISGFDILFFWDARMAMQGLHFMKEVPWKTLYLHGLVRAADGSKMSKSKGNTVDPLGLIDKYGADALRFFMAAMESQGRDIKLDERRLEGYRNFATKLWNASRFAQSNGIGGGALPATITQPVNHWLAAEVQKTVAALDLALADLRFDEAANTVYHFVWDRFCDWYLELIKGQIDDETKAVAGWALDRILVMLHPFMPFVTEELWHALAARDHDLIVGEWPVVDAKSVDADAVIEVEWLIRLVSELRAARTELGVPPAAKLPLMISQQNPTTETRVDRHFGVIARMARIEVPVRADPPAGSAQVVVDEATYALPLAGVIDFAAERARLTKSAEAAEKEAASLAGRLNNPSFVERAKPEAVEKARADHAEKSAEAERLRAALARLG